MSQSKIKTYSQIFGLDFDEVKEWVNDYINRPGEFPSLVRAGLIEETREARRESIEAYITREIDESMTGRLRREIFEERAAIAEFDGGLSRPAAEELARREMARL